MTIYQAHKPTKWEKYNVFSCWSWWCSYQ